MPAYYVEYKFRKTSLEGNSFIPTDDYHKNYKEVTVRAKDTDDLRSYLIHNIFKGRTGTSNVFKLDSIGMPDYDRMIGQLYRYMDEYVWFIRNTKTGWIVNPQTGRRMR